MSSIEKHYNKIINKDSDIREHLETLKNYSNGVDDIIEMGVRWGNSTCALIMGKPKKLTSYDIKFPKLFNLEKWQNMAKEVNVSLKFIEADSLKITIEPTDLLFIDTYHSYTQLKKELELHGNKSKKYIILHDTVTFGEIGMDKKKPGLVQAINEFIEQNSHWKIRQVFTNNNGLTVLERS